jgi:hypothetical protein
MSDIQDEEIIKPRRTIVQEFCRMEDDFDFTRNRRLALAGKLLDVADSITMVDEKGQLSAEIEDKVKVLNLAFKGLSEIEKANGSAISLKLKQKEQEVASAALARERIEIVLRAARPGRIEESYDSDKLEAQLNEMFDNDEIKPFELKTSPRDLTD